MEKQPENLPETALTNADNYGLTAAEQRLLAVKLNPENYGKSITAISKLAEISREAYYEIIKRPRWAAAYSATSMDFLRAHIGDILQASVKFAKSDKGGHQDRKMLLEMAGVYVPPKMRLDADIQMEAQVQAQHGGNVTIVHQVQFVAPEEPQK